MKKVSIKAIFVRLFVVLVCLLSAGMAVFNPIALNQTPTYSCSKEMAVGFPSISDVLKNLFRKSDEIETENKESVQVYLGGYPLGFTISCSGVVVVAISNETANELKEGDVIKKVEDIKISSAEQILTIINSETFKGQKVKLLVSRKNKEFETTIKPIYDSVQNLYKLGLWIRDNAAGVGTLTYVRADNKRFGALGHPVCDIDTGAYLPVSSGNIFKCNIVGLKKGVKGNPGELKGLFLRNGSVLGSLDKNNDFGVYGKFSNDIIDIDESELVEVASRNEVKSGKAKIRCTIDGTTPKDYEIEIVKTYFQSEEETKSMFIRVTDKELLSKTGGIIQGMSGSPIIQNGKLVGAVTHVFVSDPTKGYGVYADWMIKN